MYGIELLGLGAGAVPDAEVTREAAALRVTNAGLVHESRGTRLLSPAMFAGSGCCAAVARGAEACSCAELQAA